MVAQDTDEEVLEELLELEVLEAELVVQSSHLVEEDELELVELELLEELVRLELELVELDVHGSHEEAGEAATEPAMAATTMAAENFILIVGCVWMGGF